MAVDAVYLFDEKMQIRRAIVWGVYELIQDEATYELDAEIDAKHEAKPGEFLGFSGIDGEFLLFEIDKAEIDDKRGALVITATYAPVKELTRLIAREIRLTGADVQTAAQAALSGSGWLLGEADAGGRTADLSKYYETRWKVLKEIAVQYQARVTPRYEFDGRRVTKKIVDVTPRGNVYRGRIFEGANGTSQIYVTYTGSPVTRLYGIGKATGEEDPPTCVTIRDAAWSKASGDPADKPAGQDYIEDLEAIEAYGHGREAVFQDKNIEDPAQLLSATWDELQRLKRPKISGTATIADMEHIPGYAHKIARMYDLVWVRTRRGVDVSAAIINIKRNHLHKGRTKIYVGEEADDSGLIKKIADLSKQSKADGDSLRSATNRLIITRQEVQVNADLVQVNARDIDLNAKKIEATASNFKAFEEGTEERLWMAELTLYGDKDLAEAGLVAKVGENEAKLLLHADELGTLAEIKADVTYVKRLVAEEIEAALADFDFSVSGSLVVGNLSVSGSANFTTKVQALAGINVTGDADVSGGVYTSYVNTEDLTVDGKVMSVQEIMVPTSAYLPHYVNAHVRLADGGTIEIYALTSRPQINTKKILCLAQNTSSD